MQVDIILHTRSSYGIIAGPGFSPGDISDSGPGGQGAEPHSSPAGYFLAFFHTKCR